jgi:hypothetical protein
MMLLFNGILADVHGYGGPDSECPDGFVLRASKLRLPGCLHSGAHFCADALLSNTVDQNNATISIMRLMSQMDREQDVQR